MSADAKKPDEADGLSVGSLKILLAEKITKGRWVTGGRVGGGNGMGLNSEGPEGSKLIAIFFDAFGEGTYNAMLCAALRSRAAELLDAADKPLPETTKLRKLERDAARRLVNEYFLEHQLGAEGGRCACETCGRVRTARLVAKEAPRG